MRYLGKSATKKGSLEGLPFSNFLKRDPGRYGMDQPYAAALAAIGTSAMVFKICEAIW